MSKETFNDAPVPMTPEQKFFFDLRGWILLPSILSDAEIEEMKAKSMRAQDKVIKAHFRTSLTIPQL